MEDRRDPNLATPAARSERPVPGTPLPASLRTIFEGLTVDDPAPREAPGPWRRPLLELFPIAPSTRDFRREALTAFYGLTEQPFSPAADPRFFYHSAVHDAVVQQLLTAIRNRETPALLLGEPGVGKTSACHVVADQVDRQTLTSIVGEPVETAEQLLTRILVDLGVLSSGDAHRRAASRDQLMALLQSAVESLTARDALAVIFVDEAQGLSPEVFEEVRALCEAAHATSLLQIVLVGRPSLADRLRPDLNQRFAVRLRLDPLPQGEVGDYIQHRLSVAGNARVEFEHAAVARVFALSGGVPGAINALCGRALLIGYERTAALISESLIDAAAAALDLSAPWSAMATALARLTAVLFMLAFLLIGAAGAGWIFRDALTRAVTHWETVPAVPGDPRRYPPPLVPPAPPDGVQRPPG